MVGWRAGEKAAVEDRAGQGDRADRRHAAAIWGELLTLDLKIRTGTFRNESNDEVMPFTVLPYAELLHHAAFGDLQDFKVGERSIFRLHQDEAGKWIWLTYIQDEMKFLNNHKEYYWVDALDSTKGEIAYTQANADKSFVRGKGLILETDAQTRVLEDRRTRRNSPISRSAISYAPSRTASVRASTSGCWKFSLTMPAWRSFRKSNRPFTVNGWARKVGLATSMQAARAKFG